MNIGDIEKNIDHIIPRSLISISELWNLQLLCIPCNATKGSILPSNFKELCQATNERNQQAYIKEKESQNKKIPYSYYLMEEFLHNPNGGLQKRLYELYEDDVINYRNHGRVSFKHIIQIVRIYVFQNEDVALNMINQCVAEGRNKRLTEIENRNPDIHLLELFILSYNK